MIKVPKVQTATYSNFENTVFFHETIREIFCFLDTVLLAMKNLLNAYCMLKSHREVSVRKPAVRYRRKHNNFQLYLFTNVDGLQLNHQT